MMIKKIVLFLLILALFLTGCGKSVQVQISEQMELGEKYLTQGDYEQAIVAFDKVIELDAKEFEAYVGKIYASAYMNQYKDAEDTYANLLQVLSGQENEKEWNDTLIQKLTELAEKWMADADIEHAGDCYDFLLKIAPDYADAFLGKAECLLAEGKFDEAENTIKEGIRRNPGDEALSKKEAQFTDGLITDYKDRTIKQIWRHADGSLSSYTCTQYDEAGNREVRNYDAADTLKSISQVTCDENGKRIKSVTYRADGTLASELEKLDSGVEHTVGYDQDGTISYIVDADESGTKTYDADGRLIDYSVNERNEKGQVVKRSYYSADGELLKYFLTEYDDDEGNRISHAEYNPDGSVKGYLDV